MKTKNLLMLIAAMLLSCASAFAQSGNTPAKGDVNEDGTVDVADIVNVIKIMKEGGGAVGEKMCYWYAGTNNGNAVTADNFTGVASRIPESEVPETGSVTANGQFVYFVMPETKHLESLTDGNGSAVEFTCTDVMGYHIYKTNDKINGIINYSVVQTVYYWYAGQNQPTSTDVTPEVDDENFTNNKWHTLGSATTIAKTITGGTSGLDWYVAVPTAVGLKATASDLSTPNTSWDNIGTITINNNSYTVWRTNSTGGRCSVYMAK